MQRRTFVGTIHANRFASLLAPLSFGYVDESIFLLKITISFLVFFAFLFLLLVERERERSFDSISFSLFASA